MRLTNSNVLAPYKSDTVSYPKLRPVKNRKQKKVLLILKGAETVVGQSFSDRDECIGVLRNIGKDSQYERQK